MEDQRSTDDPTESPQTSEPDSSSPQSLVNAAAEADAGAPGKKEAVEEKFVRESEPTDFSGGDHGDLEDVDSFPRAGEGDDSAALQLDGDESVSASGGTEEAGQEFSLPAVLESILFTSQKPVAAKEVLQILRGAAATSPENPVLQNLGKSKEATLRQAIETLQDAYRETGRSFEIRESAAGWQLVTKPLFAPWLRQLFPENRPARLSAPALETLSIIAYRQPITRADIEAVRGVAVDGVMQTLLDRGLIKIAGRAEVPGRPLLYATSQHFMEHFGLRDLGELPNAGELRTRPLPKASPPESAASTDLPSQKTAADSPGENESAPAQRDESSLQEEAVRESSEVLETTSAEDEGEALETKSIDRNE